MWATVTRGKPTKKQEQKTETIKKIIMAFYIDDKKEHRTWAQLKTLTKLSNGALSKYIRELVEKDLVKCERKVINGRLQTLYEYRQKGFEIVGKPYGLLKAGRPPKRVLDETKRKKKVVGRSWGIVKKVS
jgi:hypothetical protein